MVVRLLAEAGVDHVVLCPGSRSAPLAYALAEAESAGWLQIHVRIDERSAGFTALGMALGSGAPAAVVTTSGTAVGNLLPAVMEANHAQVPLVILSADRPAELHGTGANQTTEQFDLFGQHVRFAADVAADEDPRRAVATALSAARGELEQIPAGPVQLNLAFREPLTPAQDGSDWQLLEPMPEQAQAPQQESAKAPAVANALAARRTVIIAGHDAGPEAQALAIDLGLPLLAEPSSNARFGPNAIGAYRLLLDHFSQDIERVVMLGRPTLSRPIAALLARAELPRAIYLPRPVAWFTAGRRPEQPITDWAELREFAGSGAPDWLASWQRAGAAAELAVEQELAGDTLNGLGVAAAVWASDTAEQLVLGSSNPIRDVDLAGQPERCGMGSARRVFANRGLAGIDGTIATATGAALASGTPTRVLLGDLTFLHDAGSLLLGVGERIPDLQLIVLNDGGGGIFATLEHGALADQAPYSHAVERFFGTPHTADVQALASAYGVQYRTVRTAAELKAALREPIAGRSIIEVHARREDLRPRNARVAAAVRAVVAL